MICFSDFLNNLNVLNDGDRCFEDALGTQILNPLYDAISYVFVKTVRNSHIQVQTDEFGREYYETIFGGRIAGGIWCESCDFINNFQILNPNDEVGVSIILNETRYNIFKNTFINVHNIKNNDSPVGIRFTFKNKAFPVTYSYVAYLLSIDSEIQKIFKSEFEDKTFL